MGMRGLSHAEAIRHALLTRAGSRTPNANTHTLKHRVQTNHHQLPVSFHPPTQHVNDSQKISCLRLIAELGFDHIFLLRIALFNSPKPASRSAWLGS